MGGEILVQTSKYIVFLTINKNCPLSCDYCYAKGTDQKIMSIKLVKESINFLNDLGVNYAIISGGEPSIHPNFLEIVSLLHKSGLKIILNTNAIAFADKHFLNETLERGDVIFNLSLKAVSREKFIKNTGIDLFDKHIAGIKNIVESESINIFSTVLCENMINDFDKIIEIGKNLNIGKILAPFPYPAYLNNSIYTDGMLTPAQIADFIHENYEKIINDNEIIFDLRLPMPFCSFPEGFWDNNLENLIIRTGCLARGGRTITIDRNGDIFPCNVLCWPAIGRLGKDFHTAREFIRYKKDAQKIIDLYKKINSLPMEECQNCQYFLKCRGGCPLLWKYNDKKFLERPQ